MMTTTNWSKDVLAMINDENNLSLTENDIITTYVGNDGADSVAQVLPADGSDYIGDSYVTYRKRSIEKFFLGVPIRIKLTSNKTVKDILDTISERYRFSFDESTDFTEEVLATEVVPGQSFIKIVPAGTSAAWEGELTVVIVDASNTPGMVYVGGTSYTGSTLTVGPGETTDSNAFFKQDKDAPVYSNWRTFTMTTPDTTTVTENRDEDGYVDMAFSDAADFTVNVGWLNNEANNDLPISLTYGGVYSRFTAMAYVGDTANAADLRAYEIQLPDTATPSVINFTLDQMQETDYTESASTPQVYAPGAGIQNFEVAVPKNVEWSTGCDIVGKKATFWDDRSASVLEFTATDTAPQCVMLMKRPAAVEHITYNSAKSLTLRLTDADNWNWEYILPVTDDYNDLELDATKFTLGYYQPNHEDTDTKPTDYIANPATTSYTLLYDADAVVGDKFYLYCVNTVPGKEAEEVKENDTSISGSWRPSDERVAWQTANTSSMAWDNAKGSLVYCMTGTDVGQQVKLESSEDTIIRQIIYRSTADYDIRVKDANGWLWLYKLPASEDWVTLATSLDKWVLSGYQPDQEGIDSRNYPEAAFFGNGTKEFTFLPSDDALPAGNKLFIYYVNQTPKLFSEGGVLNKFGIDVTVKQASSIKFGDCTIGVTE